MHNYLIYGANGYTGELIAREAKARGHAPILAGRNLAAVNALADELGLPARSFSLDSAASTDHGLSGVTAVLLCAGPFARTSRPMADACLRKRVHYLDVTGEIPVFEALFARNAEAKRAGVSLLPGMGFDVVPSDCLAAHLRRRLPSATKLTLGFKVALGMSRGTAITTIEGMGRPNLVRRGGRLTELPMGSLTRTIDFGQGPTPALSIPWGDVATAYYSTDIPDIEVYAAVPRAMQVISKLNAPLAPLLRSRALQALLKGRAERGPAGPDAAQRAAGRSWLWGEASDATGARVVSRLQTPEGYALTVLTALKALDKLLAGEVGPGVYTPSSAFGPDWVLEIPGVQRSDEA